MAETIEYEQFEQPGGEPVHGGEGDLQRLSDIPMELSVEIGRARTTVGETLSLRVGSVVELEHDAGAPADLLVNGTPIARGEVVVVDERYGLRITEILDAQDSETAVQAGESPADGAGENGTNAGEATAAEA